MARHIVIYFDENMYIGLSGIVSVVLKTFNKDMCIYKHNFFFTT